MINAFCLLFGNYVDRITRPMCEAGKVIREGVLSIAEVCQNFSLEANGLVSSTSAWMLLTKRHVFLDPEVVEAINDMVLDVLMPPDMARHPYPVQTSTAVIGPDDRSDEDSQDERDRQHVTEVFLPDQDILGPPSDGELPPSPEEFAPPPLPEDDFPA